MSKVYQFEKYFVSLLAITSGIIIAYLAIIGPMFLDVIQYKTSHAAIIQMKGQDLANIVFLSPLLIMSGIMMLLNNKYFKYLLIVTPLSVIYYALSYMIGLEWSSPLYSGNSEKYFYYFLFLIVSSLIIMFHTLNQFKGHFEITIKRKNLIIYSIVFVFALLMFMRMWMSEVNEVIKFGTTTSYDETPTVFWTIRALDLGFVIPLGLISLYLLWTRLNQSIALQFLFYGFFITMGIAVNAMGLLMLLNNDPAFSFSGQIVFIILLLIASLGYYYIISHVKEQKIKI